MKIQFGQIIYDASNLKTENENLQNTTDVPSPSLPSAPKRLWHWVNPSSSTISPLTLITIVNTRVNIVFLSDTAIT